MSQWAIFCNCVIIWINYMWDSFGETISSGYLFLVYSSWGCNYGLFSVLINLSITFWLLHHMVFKIVEKAHNNFSESKVMFFLFNQSRSFGTTSPTSNVHGKGINCPTTVRPTRREKPKHVSLASKLFFIQLYQCCWSFYTSSTNSPTFLT